jgi:hypothetical protein
LEPKQMPPTLQAQHGWQIAICDYSPFVAP